MSAARKLLLDLFHSALLSVNGEQCVKSALAQIKFKQPVAIVAVGKAAMAMATGAYNTLGDKTYDGLVITKNGYSDHNPRDWPFEVIESSHPIPDATSIAAGHRLIEFISKLPNKCDLLLLISGGTSSLVESLPESFTKSDLAQLNTTLLSSGYAIETINLFRKRSSLIKGGRLAKFIKGRRTEVLLISDVPDNEIKTIGSGMTVHHSKKELALDSEEYSELIKLSPEISPLAYKPSFKSIAHRIIADNAMAIESIERRLEKAGIPYYRQQSPIQGDVIKVSHHLFETVITGEDGVYIWGGETTVKLPDNPGRGGRCQTLALSIAVAIEMEPRITFLACGTDGSDGTGMDAGAIVDGKTIYRGEVEGEDPLISILLADSGEFLEQSGDLIQTGPTGTNVMDLMIAIKGDEAMCQKWLSQIRNHLHSVL